MYSGNKLLKLCQVALCFPKTWWSFIIQHTKGFDGHGATRKQGGRARFLPHRLQRLLGRMWAARWILWDDQHISKGLCLRAVSYLRCCSYIVYITRLNQHARVWNSDSWTMALNLFFCNYLCRVCFLLQTVEEIYKVSSIALSPNVPAQIFVSLVFDPFWLEANDSSFF